MSDEHSDELFLVADMLEGLSATEQGVTVSIAQSIARRLRTVARALQEWEPADSQDASRRKKCDGPLASRRKASPASRNSTSAAGISGGVTGGALASASHSAATVNGSGASDPFPLLLPDGDGSLRKKAVLTPTLSLALGHRAVTAAVAPRSGSVPRSGDLRESKGAPARFRLLRPTTLRDAAISGLQNHTDRHPPPKEVVHVMTATLYNLLESITVLLRASSANIFVRFEEEMVSIANVGDKLVFPPRIVRHPLNESEDSNVLLSGIALSDHTLEEGRTGFSRIIFPVYLPLAAGHPDTRRGPIATLHVSNKVGGQEAFNETDESFLLSVSQIVGEVMARVPALDWLTSFYDPVAQHIVAPFESAMALPPLVAASGPESANKSGKSALAATEGRERDALEKVAAALEKREFFVQAIRRRSRRYGHDSESEGVLYDKNHRIAGLSAVPCLREVDVYLNNLRDCWGKSVNKNIMLLEEERQRENTLKVLRCELNDLKVKYEEAVEQLRLLRLNGDDYRREYVSLERELQTFLQRRHRLPK